QSGAWPEGKVFTGQADLAVLLELANKAERPIHLVGHSYGAALALEAARGLGSKVQSLTLVEPVAFNLLRVERRPEWAEIEQLGVAVLTAVSNGNDRDAASAFMRYWLGRLRWWLAPEKFKAAITATIHEVHDPHRNRLALERLCEPHGANFTDRWRQDARSGPRGGRHAEQGP